MSDDWDEIENDDLPCPACGHHETRSRTCGDCGGNGFREYLDAPEEWGEDCPSEENHPIDCRECSSTGIQRWCPKCGADYWVAQEQARRKSQREPRPVVQPAEAHGAANTESEEA